MRDIWVAGPVRGVAVRAEALLLTFLHIPEPGDKRPLSEVEAGHLYWHTQTHTHAPMQKKTTKLTLARKHACTHTHSHTHIHTNRFDWRNVFAVDHDFI